MGIREWVGKNYKEVVRWGALSDIVSTGPFALPIIVNLQIANLKLVHDTLQLGGDFPQFESFHYLFCVLMGTMVLAWSTLRVINPDPIFGLVDGITELFYAAFLYYYAKYENVTEVVYFFVVLELVWAFLHIGGYFSWWSITHPRRKVITVKQRKIK